jgi:AP2-associated kinase
MLKETEKEIQVMKALRGNDRIVEYLDSEMRRLESRRDGGPGWEVFILMEFCGGRFACTGEAGSVPLIVMVYGLTGGGIIDLLNKRLRDRLREDEILTIFVDVCEAVAHMHTLPQPLLHRDLKVSLSRKVD